MPRCDWRTTSESHVALPSNIGRFARASLAEAHESVVVAVFSRAAYLRCAWEGGHGVVALTTLDVPPGPLHVRMSRLPRLSRGEAVFADAGRLVTATETVKLPRAPWIPPRIDGIADRRSAAAMLLDDVLGIRGLLDVAGKTLDVRALVAERGLQATLASLAGRGLGLTPAGDDCSAGIVLVTALLHSEGFPPFSPRELSSMVAGYDSHEIAVAFLEAAAAGESIEPLHLLLRACVEGDQAAAMRQREVLAGIGRTSGLDLAYGAGVGLALAETISSESCEGRVRERITRRSQRPA